MLGSTYVEMAIGLALMYLMLSLICSVAWEWVAKQGAVRAEMLRSAIRQMLGSDAASAFYEHPLIRGLGTIPSADHPILSPLLFQRANRHRWNPPSFIPPELFARVLGEVMAEHPQAAIGRDIWASFNRGGQVDPKAVAEWFDAAMKRLSSRYQRTSQGATLLLALPLVLAFNADSILVANRLLRDKSLRDTLVAGAATFVKDHPELATPPAAAAPAASGSAAPSPAAGASSASSAGSERFVELAAQLERLSLPIGWASRSEVEKARKSAEEASKKRDAAKKDLETATARRDVAVAESDRQAQLAAGAQRAMRKADRALHQKVEAQRVAKPDDPDARRAVDEAKALAANAKDEADDHTADATEALVAADKAKADLEKAKTEENAAGVALDAARGAADQISLRAWPLVPLAAGQALLRVGGWILTALAISLGARFWFDTLGKLFSIRGAGEKASKPTP